jgi:hypothetical protein
MLKKISLVIYLLLLFEFCCTKKKCSAPEIPLITIKFNNLTPNQDNRGVILTLQNNVITDSLAFNVFSTLPSIEFWPYQDHNDQSVSGKKYIVKCNNHSDTILNVSCSFFEKKVKCNTCFPIGD